MLTIRIPTLKYLPQVITQLQELNFNYDIDLSISIDRWSDELELAELDNAESGSSSIAKLRELVQQGSTSSKQMAELRNHLRGE